MVTQYALSSGMTKSCGCLRQDVAAERGKKTLTTHGLSMTPEWISWQAAKRRCYWPGEAGYKNYGGRGIGMCARWRNSFENFLADMGPRPEKHTLERKDNNGNYEPGNCVWATHKEQIRNRRTTHLYKARGEALTAAEWSARVGLPAYTIEHRVRAGWGVEKALSTPSRPYKRKP